ncbi:MAG: hypothetical protein K2P85_08695 [Flavobacteriaceae bacterium]|nr:hypothetical protein [Flavobacteriaceae bacterium]
MSERWKYQIKTGSFWGIFMMVFTTLFELKEHPFKEQIAFPQFWIRFLAYLVLGIFGLGYYNWKQNVKNQKKDNQLK